MSGTRNTVTLRDVLLALADAVQATLLTTEQQAALEVAVAMPIPAISGFPYMKQQALNAAVIAVVGGNDLPQWAGGPQATQDGFARWLLSTDARLRLAALAALTEPTP